MLSIGLLSIDRLIFRSDILIIKIHMEFFLISKNFTTQEKKETDFDVKKT